MIRQTKPDGPKRRPRYTGRNPRHFAEKYKEHSPDRYPDDVAKVITAGKTPAGTHRPIMVDEILEILAQRRAISRSTAHSDMEVTPRRCSRRFDLAGGCWVWMWIPSNCRRPYSDFEHLVLGPICLLRFKPTSLAWRGCFRSPPTSFLPTWGFHPCRSTTRCRSYLPLTDLWT